MESQQDGSHHMLPMPGAGQHCVVELLVKPLPIPNIGVLPKYLYRSLRL